MFIQSKYGTIYIYTSNIGNTKSTKFLDACTALISIQTSKAGAEGNCWVYLLADTTERLIGLPKGNWFSQHIWYGIIPQGKIFVCPMHVCPIN